MNETASTGAGGAPMSPGAPGPAWGAPRDPRSAGFFDSIRRSGWFRAENRTVGGVCSGIAAKTGWDLVLVRGIALVLLILGWPLLAVYGAAWALLPEQRDGRIHAEELIAGRLDAAQLGSGLLILIGLSAVVPVSANFSSDSPLAFVGAIASFTAVALVIVLFVVVISRSTRAAASHPVQGPSAAYGHFPASSAGAWSDGRGAAAQGAGPGAAGPRPSSFDAAFSAGAPAPSPSPMANTGRASEPHSGQEWRTQGGPVSGSAGASAQQWQAQGEPGAAPAWAGPAPGGASAPPQARQPYSAAPAWAPPILAPVPRVSRRVNLLLTGFILIVMAVTFAAMYWASGTASVNEDRRSELVVTFGLAGGGACLLIVGLALAIASMRGKNAGWLIALTLVGCLLAVPTVLVGLSFTNTGSGSAFGSSITDDEPARFDWSTSVVHGNAYGQATLDLTGAPSDYTGEIAVGASVYEFTISAREDQPVRIICTQGVDDVVAAYWKPAAPDWAGALRGCGNLEEGEEITTHSSTWSEGRGITIRIDTWLTTLYYSEDASALEADAGEPTDPQSGAADQPESSGAAASASTARAASSAFGPATSPLVESAAARIRASALPFGTDARPCGCAVLEVSASPAASAQRASTDPLKRRAGNSARAALLARTTTDSRSLA